MNRLLLSIQNRVPRIKQTFVKPPIAQNVPDNLYEFAERLRQGGLRVDNRPFKWDGFEYLIEPYKSLRFTGQTNPQGLHVVMQCGAQVGKSVTGFMMLVHLALYFWGQYFGYFLPDREMSQNFSAERFKPMVMGIPEIRPLWGIDPTADDTEKQTDKKGVRSIGPSKIIFSYLLGLTSTEGWPLLGVIFDEVRRMLDTHIELVEERLSHSPYPINFKYSTAGFPDVNIDKAYKRTNQNKFHSSCRCKDGVILADLWPDCIGQKSPGMTPAFRDLPNIFYICPVCKEVITNPRDGLWIPHRPSEKRKIGWHIPQTLSCAQTAESIYTVFLDAKNIQEFYNSKLGVAYLSKESRLIDEDILRATVNSDLKWLTKGTNFAMGVDQMGGFNVVTIRYWGPKSDLGVHKSRIAHLEIVWSDDPWKRCGELMHQFDISMCVADALPNSNEALRFAKAFPGRVFLCEYNYTPESGTDDICEWGDRPKESATEKKASDDTKFKYTVRANRYLALEWNLMKYVNRLKEQPHEKGLVAEVQDERGGQKRMEFVCENIFWVHLQKLARVKEEDEQTGRIKMNFVNIGIDPHFAHSDLYAELALSRVNPDPMTRAFADYGTREVRKFEHDWQPMENGQHFQCGKCKWMVAPLQGQTPDEAAEAAGRSRCAS